MMATEFYFRPYDNVWIAAKKRMNTGSLLITLFKEYNNGIWKIDDDSITGWRIGNKVFPRDVYILELPLVKDCSIFVLRNKDKEGECHSSQSTR